MLLSPENQNKLCVLIFQYFSCELFHVIYLTLTIQETKYKVYSKCLHIQQSPVTSKYGYMQHFVWVERLVCEKNS